MKFTCQRSALASAFQAVNGVVQTKSSRAILQNIKVDAANDRVTLSGTDAEIGIRCVIDGVSISQPGTLLLPASKTLSILKECRGELITVKLEGVTVYLMGDRSEFKLSSSDPAEFPDVPEFQERDYYLIPANVLRQGIARTLFAADVESTRYALGGVVADFSNGKMTFVATDTRRLAISEGVFEKAGNPEAPEVLPVIPQKAMSLVERLLSDCGAEDVSFSVTNKNMTVRAGNTTIRSRLVEGRFPQYRSVVPSNPSIRVEILAGAFHAAVRQALIVTNEESRGVDFNFSAGLLTLNSKAAEVGQSKIEVPIGYDGEPLTITFDPRYVADFLKVLESVTQVVVELVDPETAGTFRVNEDYTYVVMPLSRS